MQHGGKAFKLALLLLLGVELLGGNSIAIGRRKGLGGKAFTLTSFRCSIATEQSVLYGKAFKLALLQLLGVELLGGNSIAIGRRKGLGGKAFTRTSCRRIRLRQSNLCFTAACWKASWLTSGIHSVHMFCETAPSLRQSNPCFMTACFEVSLRSNWTHSVHSWSGRAPFSNVMHSRLFQHVVFTSAR